MAVRFNADADTGNLWTRRRFLVGGLLISGAATVVSSWLSDSVDAKKKKRRKKRKKKKGSATESNPPAHWEMDGEEQEFLRLINDYRAEKGKKALTLKSQLTVAAAAHSLDMGLHNYFSHTGKSKRTKDPGKRASAAGYRWRVIGENIAAGTAQDTAAEAFAMWQSSNEHNANMLDGAFRDIGIGREQVPGSKWGWYWTTVFGTSA